MAVPTPQHFGAKSNHQYGRKGGNNLIPLVMHLDLHVALKLGVGTQSKALCKMSEDNDTFCKMKTKPPYLRYITRSDKHFFCFHFLPVNLYAKFNFNFV